MHVANLIKLISRKYKPERGSSATVKQLPRKSNYYSFLVSNTNELKSTGVA